MKILKSKIYENNYSIKEIANIFNISEQTLTNWIHVRNTSSIFTFLKITKFLNFTIENYEKLLK